VSPLTIPSRHDMREHVLAVRDMLHLGTACSGSAMPRRSYLWTCTLLASNAFHKRSFLCAFGLLCIHRFQCHVLLYCCRLGHQMRQRFKKIYEDYRPQFAYWKEVLLIRFVARANQGGAACNVVTRITSTRAANERALH
jgi:hypothetical protein